MTTLFQGGLDRKIVPPIHLVESKFSTVQVLTTPTKLLTLNPYRLAFMLGTAASTNVVIWPAAIRPSGKGIQLALASGFFECRWADHPAMVGLEWYAIDSVGGVLIEVAEDLAVR